MKKVLLVVILLTLALSACGSSENAIQTAIAKTQVAMPTETSLPSTKTPTPTLTPTPTITASPTLDLRVIDVDPQKLLLKKEDLPASGKYSLPGPGWTSPVTNAEIVSSWTADEGKAYLSDTGRIHGWEVTYRRGTSGAVLPEEVYNNTVIFSSIEGAQILISKYGNRANRPELESPNIGDASRAFKINNSNGTVTIIVLFRYRNIVTQVVGWGQEKDVTLEFVTSIAKILLRKFEQVQLSSAVSFTP